VTLTDQAGHSVVTETLPGSQVGLKIEVPPEQVDSAYRRVLQRLSQRVRIEGFRPGKAPHALVEARVGPAALREEVVDLLVPPLVSGALAERGIVSIDRPVVEVHELERGRPGRVEARVSVMPEVTLPDLDSLTIERRHTDVDEAMVERRIAELLDGLAEIEPVDREVRAGDIVVADLRVLVDGKEVSSKTRKGAELEARDGHLRPELMAVLPGARVGDTVKADVVLAEDDSDPNLRGKPALLQVEVQGLKEKHVPELTDEIAEKVSGGERKTVSELREAVRADLVDQAHRLDELAFEQAVATAVVGGSTLEVPAALVEREVDRRVSAMEDRLAKQGLKLDRYFEYTGRTEAQYRSGLEPEARDKVKAELVLEEAARRLEVAPGDEEVTAYIRSEAEGDQDVAGNVRELERNQVVRDYFGARLARIKALEALVVRYGPVPQAESKVE
jgi:trigger factor